jgi:hypothetical protein
VGAVHLHQHGEVALDDEGIFGCVGHESQWPVDKRRTCSDLFKPQGRQPESSR